ncbi:MAG: VWA domain-containing protein [Nitrospirae bacterium]|nr:VWA domain-containing protein [Nitrospirota bacterium]
MKFLIAIISIILILYSTHCHAQAEAPAGTDIVLLMDSSGSMKKTDPKNYRKPAARLFVSLLGEGNNIGIISFGDSAASLQPLIENKKENQGKIFSAIEKISSAEAFTNITEAVRKGFEELKSSRHKDKVIILMSDGRIDLGSAEKDGKSSAELSALLKELQNLGVKLYSIAFTEESDIKLLENMAKETGGFSRIAKTDKDIHIIFASMFEKIKSPDTVPLEGDMFNIDKYINEATVLITKEEGSLTTVIDPLQAKHTPAKHGGNILWHSTNVFDMITIKNPAVGKWNVSLSSKDGNKVFVITNLSLKSSFNKEFVHKGDKIKIDVWLTKGDGVLTEKEVLEKTLFTAEIVEPEGGSEKINLFDSGEGGDTKAGDGVYSGEFAVTGTGEYIAKVNIEGKTFKREKVFQFKAEETPISPAKHPSPVKKASSQKDASIVLLYALAGASALFAITTVYFFMASRKYKMLHNKILAELTDARNEIEELKKAIEAQKTASVEVVEAQEEAKEEIVGEEKYAELIKEKEEMNTELISTKEQIQQKEQLLEELREKYHELEREYLVLYEHHRL